MSAPARAIAGLAFAVMSAVGCANLDYARPPSDPTALVPGKGAYYVGDYVGSLSQATDNYVVYARVKTTWGLSRVSFDYEGATAALKQRFPAAASIETFPAWNARPEGGAPNALLHPVRAAHSAMLDLGTPR